MTPTPHQLKALDFIKSYIEGNRIAPTVREISDAIGSSSKGSTHRLLQGLEARKLIRTTPRMRRSIEVL